MKTTQQDPAVAISARVSPEQRAELERRAEEEDRSVSYLVRQAARDYLREGGVAA